MEGLVRILYVAKMRLCAVVSVPAISKKTASAVSSSSEGANWPFSRLGFSMVSKTVGSRSTVERFLSSRMRSREVWSMSAQDGVGP